ncbi:MAG: ABC transporter substrate-binding protein [Anaerolineae bacterium]|nr:ABC transporter substrate-binding protein [Anaerolineae bacterium]
MLRKSIFVVIALLLLVPALNVTAQPSGLPVTVPREELFVMDQIFRHQVVDNYNGWVNLSGVQPHRHAMIYETLWYLDQESGDILPGASNDAPVYNDDYTQMTVTLADSLLWTDGEPFNADDLVFTVQTLKDDAGLNASGWNSQLNDFLDTVEKVDDYTVHFTFLKPNPRFHKLFQARWNGIYMMPEHAFSQIEDLTAHTYADGPYLGLYNIVEMDPNGFWTLFQRREDPSNTAVCQYLMRGDDNCGAPYVLTILYGDSTKKAIAMSRGELDAFFNVDFEAFLSVAESTPTAQSWFPDFPWAYPNETSSRFIRFNFDTQPWTNNKDVRWALALALDIVTLQTEYIGGVAKVVYMAVPYTPKLSELYYNDERMLEWVENLEIDVAGEPYKPYDPTVADRIAEWADEQGYAMPGADAAASYGSGWWNFDPDTAAKLLEHNGYTRDDNGDWWTPEGERFGFSLQAAPDEPDSFRTANAAADMWNDFGIDVELQGLERSVWSANFNTGQFEVDSPWTSEVLPDGDGWPNVRTCRPPRTTTPWVAADPSACRIRCSTS